jgi:hypothetical protein
MIITVASTIVIYLGSFTDTQPPFLRIICSHEICNTNIYQPSFPLVLVGVIPTKYQPIPTEIPTLVCNSRKYRYGAILLIPVNTNNKKMTGTTLILLCLTKIRSSAVFLWINSFTPIRVLAGTKNSTSNTTINKHHHHGGAVCPS